METVFNNLINYVREHGTNNGIVMYNEEELQKHKQDYISGRKIPHYDSICHDRESGIPLKKCDNCKYYFDLNKEIKFEEKLKEHKLYVLGINTKIQSTRKDVQISTEKFEDLGISVLRKSNFHEDSYEIENDDKTITNVVHIKEIISYMFILKSKNKGNFYDHRRILILSFDMQPEEFVMLEEEK